MRKSQRCTKCNHNHILVVENVADREAEADNSTSARLCQSGTTNIYKMSQLVDRNDEATLVRYFPGVGNEQQHGRLGRGAGTVWGAGAERLRDEVYTALVTN